VIGQKAPKGKFAKVATAVTSDGATAGHNYRGGCGGRYQSGRGGVSGHQSPTRTQKFKCYSCGELGHMARDCPQEQNNSRGGYRDSSQGGGVRVNLVSTMGQLRVETREMGVQYDDGGGQVTLINVQITPFWGVSDR